MTATSDSSAALAQILADQVTEADWSEIVAALVTEARRGNVSAAKLLVQARFGSKRWLSPATEDKETVRHRKVRLLKLLKPQLEDDADDGDRTSGINGTARVG